MDVSKEQKLKTVEDRLCQLALFLSPYLPLANAHNCDFIIQRHWDAMLPANIATELLSLTNYQLSLLPSGLLYHGGTTEHQKQHLATACTVDSTTTACIAHRHNEECRFANSTGPSQKLPESLVLHDESAPPMTWDRTEVPSWSHTCLKDFIEDATANTLPGLGVLSTLDEVRSKLMLHAENANQLHVSVKHSMSGKKSHEVNVMADLCNALAERFEVSEIIDIGSGRGYLGCHLALMYHRSVLGIDSSPGNTGAAAERTRRLRKQWRGLMKTNPPKSDVRNPAEIPQPPMVQSANNLYTPVTQFVSSNTNLEQFVSEHRRQDSNNDDHSGVTANGAVSQHLMLTGLHTCGDLSPTILRLSTTTPSCVAACHVGCCYNLLSERFVASPFEFSLGDHQSPQDEPGFPMCQLLRQCGYRLGRNARMLSCQSPERRAVATELPSPGIFWRSLLQSILLDVVGSVRDDWRVGKISANCQCFRDYVHQAAKVLSVCAELSDELLESYLAKYAEYERKNIAFFQLKMVLGPCVESLILLDRLAYLLEQGNVADAHLLRLFDTVTSPRCYALIAVKKTQFS